MDGERLTALLNDPHSRATGESWADEIVEVIETLGGKLARTNNKARVYKLGRFEIGISSRGLREPNRIQVWKMLDRFKAENQSLIRTVIKSFNPPRIVTDEKKSVGTNGHSIVEEKVEAQEFIVEVKEEPRFDGDQCNLCAFKHVHRPSQIAHIKFHKKGDGATCPECKLYLVKVRWAQHRKNVHGVKDDLCWVCQERVPILALLRHVGQKHGTRASSAKVLPSESRGTARVKAPVAERPKVFGSPMTELDTALESITADFKKVVSEWQELLTEEMNKWGQRVRERFEKFRTEQIKMEAELTLLRKELEEKSTALESYLTAVENLRRPRPPVPRS